MGRLKGKHALVIGGTGGIGTAIAKGFASEGAEVTITGYEISEVRRFRATATRVQAAVLDVTDERAVRRFVSRFDYLDILVNAAGIILRDNCEHEPSEFEHVIDVNLTGTMRAAVACRPLLAISGGCVLNIASMLSFFGSGAVPAYSASKGGVAQVTKSLAIAWAPLGIRVNAIAPGWIETAMTEPLYRNPERHRAIVERTPMKRWGKPADISGAAIFLCSADAAFITGAILPVDGGYSCA